MHDSRKQAVARWIAVVAAVAFVLITIGVSTASYRAGRRHGVADGSVPLMVVGPSGSILEDEISRRLQGAIDRLGNGERNAVERISGYSAALDEVETVVGRAILANPLDARGIERLAAVRWERGVVRGLPDVGGVGSLLAIAADRAPRAPEVQAELGATLYKMGRAGEAAAFMARAVELSPSMTNRVVGMMIDAGVEPQDVVKALPRSPHVLVALKEPFMAARQGVEFLDAVEPGLAAATPDLLAVYGEACLQLDLPARLQESLEHLTDVPDRPIMAERSRQQGHALFALGDAVRALERADAARSASPNEPTYEEFYGEVALALGRATDAELAFKRALMFAVHRDAPASVHARLYGEIGAAEEADGRGDLAVDAYRRAIALDASEPNALRRLAALEATIGGGSRK